MLKELMMVEKRGLVKLLIRAKSTISWTDFFGSSVIIKVNELERFS
jgi:hypothetical protein